MTEFDLIFQPVKVRYGSKFGLESWFLKINLKYIPPWQFPSCWRKKWLKTSWKSIFSIWGWFFNLRFNFWSEGKIRGRNLNLRSYFFYSQIFQLEYKVSMGGGIFNMGSNFQYEVKFSIRSKIFNMRLNFQLRVKLTIEISLSQKSEFKSWSLEPNFSIFFL